MEFRNLATFVKAAELGSFKRAADALNYSQATVTVQIQQLEQQLGVQLFDRIGKNITISQYGRDFLAYAYDVLNAVSRAENFTAQDSQLTGDVYVGALDSIVTASFAEVIPAFHKRFPHVVMHLHTDKVMALKTKLLKNELDLIYTVDMPLHDPHFTRVFEKEEEIVVVTNRTNPFAQRDSVDLEELADQPFILMNRTNVYRDLLDEEFHKIGLELHPLLEMEDDVLSLRLISENPEYMAIFPVYALRNSVYKGHLAPVKIKDCKMVQYRQILYHSSKTITPQMKGMMEIITEIAQKPF